MQLRTCPLTEGNLMVHDLKARKMPGPESNGRGVCITTPDRLELDALPQYVDDRGYEQSPRLGQMGAVMTPRSTLVSPMSAISLIRLRLSSQIAFVCLITLCRLYLRIVPNLMF